MLGGDGKPLKACRHSRPWRCSFCLADGVTVAGKRSRMAPAWPSFSLASSLGTELGWSSSAAGDGEDVSHSVGRGITWPTVVLQKLG